MVSNGTAFPDGGHDEVVGSVCSSVSVGDEFSWFRFQGCYEVLLRWSVLCISSGVTIIRRMGLGCSCNATLSYSEEVPR